MAFLQRPWRQFTALMRKNMLLSSRHRRITLCQGFGPVIALLLLFALAQLGNITPGGDVRGIGPVPECSSLVADACVTFAFSPNNEAAVLQIMDIIAQTQQPFGPYAITNYTGNVNKYEPDALLDDIGGVSGGFVGFPSREHVVNFTMTYPNVTQGAVNFFVPYVGNLDISVIEYWTSTGEQGTFTTDQKTTTSGIADVQFRYDIQYNDSCSYDASNEDGNTYAFVECPEYQLEMQLAVDKAFTGLRMIYADNDATTTTTDNGTTIVTTTDTTTGAARAVSLDSFLADYYVDIQVELAKWPYVAEFAFNTNSMVTAFGGLFFYICIVSNFVLVLPKLVREHEKELFYGMTTMGLSEAVWYSSWFTYESFFNIVSVVMTIVAGFALQMDLFYKTNLLVLVVIFIVFSQAMLAFAFFMSTVLTTQKQSRVFSMSFVIVGVFVQLIMSIGGILLFYLDDSKSRAVRRVFYFYPPFNFAKAVYDISYANYDFDLAAYTDTFTWTQFKNPIVLEMFDDFEMPATVDSVNLMLMNFFLYAFLTWYFSRMRKFQNPLFMLTADYWGATKGERQVGEGDVGLQGHAEDTDVRAVAVNAVNPSFDAAVRVVNLVVTFYKHALGWRKSPHDVHAVRGLHLAVEKGQLFCILGHNGAGKSTTMNVLSGKLHPSAGEVFIFGHSVKTDMAKIREIMNICPQHDILWDELTAAEHLLLFGQVKGMSRAEARAMCTDRLAAVQLTAVADKKAGSFSGGMKRRLSVAIAGMGDPQLIILDEPTTGMDPNNRRHVWEMIQELKKDRVILLTTHSMEEADALSDVIAVMGHGSLMCVGDSLHLKNRFGKGYRVTVECTEAEVVGAFIQEVQRLAAAVELTARSGNVVIFAVPPAAITQVVPLLRFLEKNESGHVKTFNISQSSLEDVFVNVSHIESAGAGKSADMA